MAQYSRFPSSSVTVGAVTANQGSANSTANAWPVKITDGTNVAGVTAASTAAAATQPAEVVALSPNSPLPAGTNSVGNIGTVTTVTAVTAITNALPAGSNALGSVSVSASALPTGAATQTTLASILSNTPALGQAVSASSSPVVIASNQSAVPGNITQVSGNALALGAATMSASIPVVVASNQTPFSVNVNTTATAPGRSAVNQIYNSYTTTNVTSSAYTTILASTASAINRLYFSDTSGAGFYLAVGAAGSEVNYLMIPPGGNDGPYEIAIASGVRLSLKSVDTATVNTGACYITCLS